MLWVKLGNYTYQSIGHNIYQNGDVWEVWITRPTGKTSLVFSGEEKRANDIYNMMNFAIEKDVKLVEV